MKHENCKCGLIRTFLEDFLKYSLKNLTKNNTIADNVTFADTFWPRMRGLMGKKYLKEDEGILLKPCNAVHMMFMRFPIDVIFLDRDFVVVKIMKNLRPWKTSPVIRKAFQTLELKAGTAIEKAIDINDKLSLIEIK
jgi:uncharacterized membrane protein (UPF0127 family)